MSKRKDNLNENKKIDEGERLKEIANSLDRLLGKSSDLWSQKEVDIYHLLKLVTEKHKMKYTMAQFRFDVEDIRRNIMELPWYQSSQYRKGLNFLLGQMVIKSYKHSKEDGNFRVVIRFVESKVNLIILKKDGLFFRFENETTFSTCSEKIFEPKVLEIFAIDLVDPDKKKELLKNLKEMFLEIGYFYQ